MLKFLTHKLRTHSLNEDIEKVEERDSGTESDDESQDQNGENNTDIAMNWNEPSDISMSGEAETRSVSPTRLMPDPEQDLMYDHHSSEEELEVINGAERGSEAVVVRSEGRRRGASSPPPAAPEKRKFLYLGDAVPPAPSDDDDDTKVETPVRFRTSPPLEALKPRRSVASSGAGLTSPRPPSPRRRRTPLPPTLARRHRPALDFDKMQQLRVGPGVRSWRGVGGAGGELSVFCW